MRKIKVSQGDIVGIAVQQSDLPMVQFLLNGEPLPSLSVNRFRGAVYPSIYLPENDGLVVSMVVSSLKSVKDLKPAFVSSNNCDICTLVSSRKAILSNYHHMQGLARSLSHEAYFKLKVTGKNILFL
jgi:hypothetical protein